MNRRFYSSYGLHGRGLACAALLAGAALLWAGPASAQQGAASPGSKVASLEERELGEGYTEDGERVIWGRALPFLAQEVVDLKLGSGLVSCIL